MALRKVSKSLLLATATLFAFVGLLVSVWQPARLYYPWLQVELPDAQELRFLLSGQSEIDQCSTLTTNMANAILRTCKNCTISDQECLSTLNSSHEALLSSAPTDIPIAYTNNGVIAYYAQDKDAALAACRESERQLAHSNTKCYPPGSSRPSKLEEKGSNFFTMPFWRSPILWAVTLLGLVSAMIYPMLIRHVANFCASLITWPRRYKQLLMLLADIISIDFSLWAAFALRLDTIRPPSNEHLLVFALAPIIAVSVFVRFDMYRSVIRYLNMQTLLTTGKALVIYGILLVVAVHMLGLMSIPRSVFIIHVILAIVIVGLSRTLARHWLRYSDSLSQLSISRKNVIIYGAGAAGIQLATALTHSREYSPKAFLDDDPKLQRHRLGALDVFPPHQLASLIETLSIQEVLLAIPSASRTRRHEIIELLAHLPVHVRTLPGLTELADGTIKTEDLREIDIEDLLGRDSVEPDRTLLQANIAGKIVMVTGAGGSIGSELCRQIISQKPDCLVLFEQSEFALYSIEQELLGRLKKQDKFPAPRIVPLLGSVTDQARVERAINAFAIQTIYHAAAYKHVPLVEMNPCEGVFNNIFGTYRAAVAALNNGVETFVLISTDKAVRPTNTMGTTKRFAELILQALAERNPQGTRFTMVRFGNVLGSSGSVVPLFREQIRRGGPITVTDPRIIRYFMTIPEAAQLVIQAGAMGCDGDVFVLDMGEPVKIVDLARRMIQLSGLQIKDDEHPDGDIEITFSGLRPGEKLYEELLIGDNVTTTNHPRIMRANEKNLPLEDLERLLHQLILAANNGDSAQIRKLLLMAVEEFKPQCENTDLLTPRDS